MKKLSTRYSCILLATFICLFLSCAGQSNLQTFAVADEEFTSTIEKYNSYYDLQDEATQKEWDEQFRPLIRESSNALDLWKVSAMSNSSDVADRQKVYLDLKTKLFQMLTPVLEGI